MWQKRQTDVNKELPQLPNTYLDLIKDYHNLPNVFQRINLDGLMIHQKRITMCADQINIVHFSTRSKCYQKHDRKLL